jgi:hypothetical protein
MRTLARLLCLAALTGCASSHRQEPLPLEARIYPRAFITKHQGPHAYFRIAK